MAYEGSVRRRDEAFDRTEAMRALSFERRFEDRVDRHERRLRRVIVGMLGDANRVDDVLQEAFLRAYRGLPARFESEQSEAAWLYRIVHRVCLNAARPERQGWQAAAAASARRPRRRPAPRDDPCRHHPPRSQARRDREACHGAHAPSHGRDVAPSRARRHPPRRRVPRARRPLDRLALRARRPRRALRSGRPARAVGGVRCLAARLGDAPLDPLAERGREPLDGR